MPEITTESVNLPQDKPPTEPKSTNIRDRIGFKRHDSYVDLRQKIGPKNCSSKPALEQSLNSCAKRGRENSGDNELETGVTTPVAKRPKNGWIALKPFRPLANPPSALSAPTAVSTASPVDQPTPKDAGIPNLPPINKNFKFDITVPVSPTSSSSKNKIKKSARSGKINKKISELEEALKNAEAKADAATVEKIEAQAKYQHVVSELKSLRSDFEVKCLETNAQAAEIKRLKFEKSELQAEKDGLLNLNDHLTDRNMNKNIRETSNAKFVKKISEAAANFKIGYFKAMLHELDCQETRKWCLDTWDGRKYSKSSGPIAGSDTTKAEAMGNVKENSEVRIPCPRTPEPQGDKDDDSLGLRIRNTESEEED